MLRLVISLLLLIGLTSCGFHLRGEIPLAAPLHNLYLQTADPYGQLARNLKQYLKFSNVHLTATPQEASVIFAILKEDTGQQLLSVGGTQQTRQYNLILTVVFQLTDPKGNVLLPPQTITETRTIPIQSNQILAGSNEASNLYRQMRQGAVYDIMNLLSSQSVTDAVMIKKPKP
ncbi:MAG: LPS-assembly lipoprotein LptE [Gammaproteobacteria bacterium]